MKISRLFPVVLLLLLTIVCKSQDNAKNIEQDLSSIGAASADSLKSSQLLAAKPVLTDVQYSELLTTNLSKMNVRYKSYGFDKKQESQLADCDKLYKDKVKEILNSMDTKGIGHKKYLLQKEYIKAIESKDQLCNALQKVKSDLYKSSLKKSKK